MENSVLNTGDDSDQVRISADARGNTTDTIAAYGALNSQIDTGNDNDRLEISATAINRNGYAEAVGLDSSTASTGSGDDDVRIHAHADGLSTNAWAMRDSELNTDSGNDRVDLRASTRSGEFDPAYGMENSVLNTGDDSDQVRISADARGNTTDTIAAYGALNSQIDTGNDNDRLEISATAI